MINFNAIIFFLKNWFNYILIFFQSILSSKLNNELEILALRSQLSLFQQELLNHKKSKPKTNHAFRQLWVLISKFFSKWKSSLIIVKPETVISWHRKSFKFFWMLKSKKKGRPKISKKIIALIQQIHKDNPLLSPKKIHERLVDLSISNVPAPNTIAKYIMATRKPPTEKQRQSWKTFLLNHSKDIWAMDFFVVPTITFKILYVFLIISHERREIIHFGITSNPNSKWVIQQLKNVTPYGNSPKYLIHDNDTIFTSKLVSDFLESSDISSKRTSIKCPWQNGVCERAIGISRQELLNHLIPFNEKHLHRLLNEFINDYYNTIRTHQSLECKAPIIKDAFPETKIENTFLKSKPILNGLYHDYKKTA